MSDAMFYPMEADGANYPQAAVPLLPPASWRGLLGRKQVAAGSAFLQGGESYTQGRYALSEAMRRSGAEPGKSVLLPAFHCRAMVEAVLYLGAQPCFYPVTADLRPDFPALSALISDSEMPAAAMVMTHYFGFPNDIEAAERLCAAHGIALIEDCAHALYGRTGERLLGTMGSYATASVWKFLPLRDGAVLLDNTGGHLTNNLAQPWLAEVKALAAMLLGWGRRVWRRPPLPGIAAAVLGEQARVIAARPVERRVDAGFKEFIPDMQALPALRLSRWIMKHAAHHGIARRRRENYMKWLEGMRSVPGFKPLFPDLPEGVVPYAFPLLVDSSGMGFHLLKTAGIPFWRWEDMAVSGCAISSDYRIRLLQLPCHQELCTEELDWMIDAVQLLSQQLDSRAGK